MSEESRRIVDLRQSPATVPGVISYGYPIELIDAQSELRQIHKVLRDVFSSPSESGQPRDAQESLEAFPRLSPWRLSNSSADHRAAAVARLRTRAAELIVEIVAHPFWGELDPAQVPAAWDALKAGREERPSGAAT